MEQLLRPIYQERASQPNTLGIIIVEKREDVSPITDTFDTVLLIVTKENKVPVYTKHYTYENKKAAMHIITEKQLHKWLLVGTNKKLIDWILFGKIVFDRNEYISDLKQNLKDFPFYGRNIKMGIEFAKLIQQKLCHKESGKLELTGSHITFKEYKGVPFKPEGNDECISCGICAKECPVNAINYENPKVTDKEKCISCMRCISLCPVHARKLNEDFMKTLEEKMAPVLSGRKENYLFL